MRWVYGARVAVFGDTSGWWAPLGRQLTKLGVVFDDPAVPRQLQHWPDDLVVVQVGDLVHKGPESELAVATVCELLLPTGRWVQLAGNHESQYLPGGVRFWEPPVHAVAAGWLQQLWRDRQMVPAAGLIDTQAGAVLCTHAGLRPGLWHQLGGRSGVDGLVDVVAALNAAAGGDVSPAQREAVFAAGSMLGQRSLPGVLWAEARHELVGDWRRWLHQRQEPLPFSQVHGHTLPLVLTTKGRRVPAELADIARIVPGSRHVVCGLAGGQLVAVDPCAGAKAPTPPKPWLGSGWVCW